GALCRVGMFGPGFVLPDGFVGLRGRRRLSPQIPVAQAGGAPCLHACFRDGAMGPGAIRVGTLWRALRWGDLGADDCGGGDDGLLPHSQSVSPSLRLSVLERISTTAALNGLWRGRAGARLCRAAAACRIVSADALGCV